MPTVISTEWLVFAADAPLLEVASNTPAWKIIDFTPLRARTRVGESRPRPGLRGRLWVAREWDEHRCVLTWRINGRKDQDGVAYADPFEGVDLNHQFLLDNLVNSLDERAVTFHDRHENLWTGTVGVDNWEPSVDPASGGDVIIAMLTLVIPDAYLTPAGSSS